MEEQSKSKKRKRDEDPEELAKVDGNDRDVSNNPSFDLKRFRKELSNTSKSITAIAQFLYFANNSDNSIDYVRKYLDNGGSPSEIVKCLDVVDKKNAVDNATVFDVFHLILNKISECIPHLLQTAEEACRYFLNSYVSTVEFMLSDKVNSKQQKVTLKLLTSMVTLSAELGVTIITQLKIQSKTVNHLIKHEKTGIRKTFIGFMMAFLVENNSMLIKALLNKHGLLSVILLDLIHDDADSIVTVFQLLQKSVLMNVKISKTLKMHTFPSYIISRLFNLFNWKPHKKSEDSSSNSKESVEYVVSNFLDILCTSHKNGIYFQDKSLGFGDVIMNPHLEKTFESLETPWKNKAANSLLIQIITKCPDLYKSIQRSIEDAFDTTKPNELVSVFSFLKHVFEALDVSKIVKDHKEHHQIERFYRNVYYSAHILRVCKVILQKPYNVLHFNVINLLRSILKSMLLWLQYMESIDYILEEAKDDAVEFKCFNLKQFPSLESLLMHMRGVLNSLADSTSEEVVEKSHHITNILDLLMLYGEFNIIDEDAMSVMLDVKILFEKIEYFQNNEIELKAKCVSYIMRCNALGAILSTPFFKTITRAMFEVFVSDDIFLVEKESLINFLNETGIFASYMQESYIFLYIIQKLSKRYRKEIPNMIVDIFSDILLNKETYITILEEYNHNIKNIYTRVTLFTIGLFESFRKLSNKYVFINSFIEQFTVNLLHIQIEPQTLKNIVKKYQICDVLSNYLRDLQLISLCIDKHTFNKEDVLYGLSSALLKNKTKNMDSFIASVPNLTILELIVSYNMVNFYTIQKISHNIMDEKMLNDNIMLIELLFKRCCEKQFYQFEGIMDVLLMNHYIIENFSLIENKNTYLTTFVLKIINIYNKNSKDYRPLNDRHFLNPYCEKIVLFFSNIIKESKKGNKGYKIENLDFIFSVIKKFVGTPLNKTHTLLNEILELNVFCFVTDDNELSSCMKILCNIMSEIDSVEISMPINKILDLYSRLIHQLDFTLNLSDFEKCIYDYLLNNPMEICLVQPNIFEDTFSVKYISKFTTQLGSLLLKTNVNLLPKFAKMITKEGIIRRELALPYALAAMNHSKLKHYTDLIKIIYVNHKTNILKIISKPQKATQLYVDNVQFILKLIYEQFEIDECKLFYKKIQKFECVEVFHLDIIEAIFYRYYISMLDDADMNCFNNFLLCILNMAITVMKKNDEKLEQVTRLSLILKRIFFFMKNELDLSTINFNEIVSNTIWLNFYKQVLLSNLISVSTHGQNQLFDNLCEFVELLYSDDHSEIVNLFEIVVSHSEFFEIILNEENNSTKDYLIRLMHTLVLKNKLVMKSSHIPLYLSAYQGTVNKTDRKILKTLKYYEDNGFLMTEYRPFLWGEAGSNYYSLRSNRKKSSLWGNPTANHVLNLLDKEKVEATIKNFPIHFELNNITDHTSNDISAMIEEISMNKYSSVTYNKNSLDFIKNKMKVQEFENMLKKINSSDTFMTHSKYNEDVYDPSFLLPILNYIMAPGSAISCHYIVRSGVIAIPLMALSSNCSKMRAAAYNVLHRFYTLLEGEMYYKNDKILWMQFINTIKSSLNTAIIDEGNDSSNPRLPSVCALYLARAAIVMTSPLDPLFKPINNFVVSKQSIDFTVVPDFLDLFHSSNISYLERRIWLLEILRDGVKSFSDVKLLFKSVVFKVLFDFYMCSFAENGVKILILEIVNNVICIPKAAKILVEAYGLSSWLYAVCKGLSLNYKKNISCFICLVKNLLTSLMIEKCIMSLNSKHNSLRDIFSWPFHGKLFEISDWLQMEFLFLLTSNLSIFFDISISDYAEYLNVLRKVSKKNIKDFLSVQQLIKLMKYSPIEYKFAICLQKAINEKQSNILMPVMTLINQDTRNEKDLVLKYLFEIVFNWLSS